MRKKNKFIIGALSAIGVGSIIVAPALGFAQTKNTSNSTNNTNKSSIQKVKNSNLASSTDTPVNSHTFNDNAYLNTLNQTGITNPVGNIWTVKQAVSYFSAHLQNDIKVFNCSQIFKWAIIQYFNYSFNELIGTLSTNTNFNVNIPTFNYHLSNIKNSDNLSNFTCSLNVTVSFVISSKNGGGSLSFTNSYTYNNLKITPTIATVGYNGYGEFALSNNAKGTLTVNDASYFSNLQLSGNWSNTDFSNLLKANLLPSINPSASITTSNYTYELKDMVQRAVHSTTLKSTQKQFMSILPTTMIDTFNLGYKFDNAASIAIVMDTKGITPNANNDYTLYPGRNVTLAASKTLSSIDLGNPDFHYQWEELSNGVWTDVGSATRNEYEFPVANTTTQYRLYVYSTKNSAFSLTSNIITINPIIQKLMIESSDNKGSYTYGTSCTLQINKNSVYDSNSVISYQWYENYTNSTLISTATKLSTDTTDPTTYKIDSVTIAGYYFLMLTFSNGAKLTSNTYFVAPSKSTSTVGIENSTPSTSMINGQIYNGSKVTLGIKTSDMDWLSGQKNLIYTLQQYNPYVTSASDQWENVRTSSTKKPGQLSFTINQGKSGHFVEDSQGEYRFKITNSQNPNYKLYSNPISLSTYSTPSLSLTINGNLVPSNKTNYYQMKNGSKVKINVNNDENHWNTTGWNYQWQYYDQAIGQWSNINSVPSPNYSNYSFDLNSYSHTTYRVHITTTDKTGNTIIDMYSNQIIIVSKQLNVFIVASSPANGSTTYSFGDNVTLSINSTTGIDLNGGTYKYTWQYYDQENGWETFQENAIGLLKFVTVRSCEWRLLLNGNGLSIYSNEIHLNTTMPTLTVSVKDKDGTAATSFPLGSVVNISTNSIKLSSYLSQNGTGTTKIYSLGSSTPLSSTALSNYVLGSLGSNTAFNATYTYTYSDSTNPYIAAYYHFSIPSTILYVNVTANPPTIVASTDNDPTPAVNTTYTFNVGSPVNLGIEGGSSWASYNPPGYTLSYQWYYYNDGTTKFVASTPSYTIPSNQAGQYQLKITCTNGKNTFSVMSDTINIIYGAIQSLSISAIANGTPGPVTEVNAQLGQRFSVSLSQQSIKNVNALLNQKDVHGYWVKIVNGKESVIQTTPNSKQIFCNAFLSSAEFKTIMQSYIALGGYGNYLGNTATFDDFGNWNVSFKELQAGANEKGGYGVNGYGNNVFGILNCLVITATNNKQITVDNFDISKNTWVPGTSVPAGSLFTWTLPYTWIDSNNLSSITPTVSGTGSGSTSMTLDYLTYKTASAIKTSLTQSEFDSDFSTKDGQNIFGFSVTNPNINQTTDSNNNQTDSNSNQVFVKFCPFNFTSSDNSHGSYSSFVKNITVTVNTSSVDNYINVPLTAIANETIKYMVVPSSYWTTKDGEMIPSSNYPSTGIPPVVSNPIFVTIPNLDNSTLSFSNLSTVEKTWENDHPDNGGDTAPSPFVEYSKSYYQVPYDQAVTLSTNVTSNIANLNQIAPGYSFYIGYYFNGDLANWEQLLNSGSGYWGYNFQQVHNAPNFDINLFPITNNESIQFVLFYTPDNTSFKSINNNQFQPTDLHVIWESNKLNFKIANQMYLTITPPITSKTNVTQADTDAQQAGFRSFGNTYVLPPGGNNAYDNYNDYVMSLDSNSSIYFLKTTENNWSSYPAMTTTWINMQTRSENTIPNAFNATYNIKNSINTFSSKNTIYNDYGIIGEFLETRPLNNPNWSIYASWFPNLYSIFEAWMSDGKAAWPGVYNTWLKSLAYKLKRNFWPGTIKNSQFMPIEIPYPNQYEPNENGYIGDNNIGKVIINGTPYNLNNRPFTGTWGWRYKGNYFPDHNTFTKNAGIGSDFQYTYKQGTNYVTNISFNYATNISDFVSGVSTNNGIADVIQSKYSFSAYAPLRFNIGAILLGQSFNKSIQARLVAFALNPQTLNSTYYNSTDTFTDVGLRVFKYVTPPITILTHNDAASLGLLAAIN